jgi:hypothetical protein
MNLPFATASSHSFPVDSETLISQQQCSTKSQTNVLPNGKRISNVIERNDKT